ncbi:MAG: RnfABCDGE type electron transport complex subunit G [Clostridia bacterium]|nr:RnfABCDGE type electron transport complex subunit G [Clostridia bacterium]
MKKIIKSTLILVAITLTAALCLSVVYAVTKDRIAEAEEKERMDSFYTVMPDANEFKDMSVWVKDWNENRSGGADIVSAFGSYDKTGNFIGVVVSVVSHNGYGGDITLSLGVDSDGVITGMKVTSMSETSGLGAECQNETWQAQFKYKSSETLVYTKKGAEAPEEIDALTGATITTKAVLEAVNEGHAFGMQHRHQEVKGGSAE